MTLALLITAAMGAWADSFSADAYAANATLNGVSVTGNQTVTINKGVTVTVNNGLTIQSNATLTVTGGGTLVVNGATGANGNDGYEDSNFDFNTGQTAWFYVNPTAGGSGGAAITIKSSAQLALSNATVIAKGGQGGQGGMGMNGPDPFWAVSGANGNGFASFPAIDGAVLSYSTNGTDYTEYESGNTTLYRYMKVEPVVTISQDTETKQYEASFQMPQYDVTATYTIKRDISVDVSAQVGDDPEAQPRYRVKKDGNKFIPADMEMAAVPALFTVNDAIEQKALTQTQDYIVQIYAIDAEGQPTGQPMTFATFTFEPGIYAVKAVAAQGSDYDGETALSNTFQLCVKSDLTLTAGSDFTIDGSKATLTVDGTDKSAAIAEGKLADVDMNANVSIAANDGYVMTALSVTCGEQNVSVNTADGVSSFTMPEAPATVAYTLTRDMSVKVTTQIAERVRIQKKEGKFDAVDPFELIPILTDKIGSTDKKMILGEETGTSGDFYIKGIQKLDGEDWVDVTELGVGTYRLVIAGKGNYDGTIYTAAIELYQGYEVTIPAGEFITYFKDENLKVEDAAAELYTIKSVTATEAVLSSKLESVPAGVPMLVYNNSQEEKTFLLIPTDEIPVSLMWYGGFKGTLEAQDMPASSASTNYYGCTGKAFVWLKSAGKIAANRCWLEISTSEPNSARKIVNGGATGVNEVREVNEVSEGELYDMSGRKVTTPNRKGIYIKNGKKVIVK